YVQEAKKKKEKLDNLKVTWHFIGHLQSNKAKQAVKFFDWIHTLDRQSLAKKLNSAVQKLRTEPLPVLIQVNVGLEDTKSGVHPDELFDLYKSVIHLDGLQVRGLMVIPPFEENPEATRVYFRNLKNLLDRLRDISPTPELLTELSMGMSHDFEVAIEEGATMVRVGTAIFGKRPAK
ncbi:MAG TPA: YggS family pyridoxal phosphate-dependent enzyme, partial [Thermodesulforhabdus norvegica]|nr:YggS family pyridoxal phosphate-dependent enzyme [Thermodesulforhabdus norvegica]